MKRKTIDVETIKNMVNERLEKSKDTFEVSGYDANSFRHGIASLLEDILHKTGNYKGFGYLESAKVKNPCTKDMTIENESRRYYI